MHPSSFALPEEPFERLRSHRTSPSRTMGAIKKSNHKFVFQKDDVNRRKQSLLTTGGATSSPFPTQDPLSINTRSFKFPSLDQGSRDPSLEPARTQNPQLRITSKQLYSLINERGPSIIATCESATCLVVGQKCIIRYLTLELQMSLELEGFLLDAILFVRPSGSERGTGVDPFLLHCLARSCEISRSSWR
jgi:hypothetical protein